MAEKAEIALYISAKEEATRVLKQVEDQVGLTSKQIRNMGLVAMAGGVAILGALGMAGKAAAEEEAGIIRLATAMKNVGISYEEARPSLEAWIDAQQQSTSVADTEQREALASLIRMTGDLAEAQDMLTLAMDVAIGTNRDLASANQMVMYAMGGNWGQVEQYIPALKEAQAEEEKWALMRRLFAGQAEAYGDSMAGMYNTMKNNLSDIVESIGGPVIEVLSDLTSSIMPVVQGTKQWMNDNPQLVKTLVLVTGAAGVLLIVTGIMAVGFAALPSILAGARIAFNLLRLIFHGVQAAATSMWGAITLGVSLAIAAGIALWQNWDKVKNWLADLWDNIKIIFAEAVKFLVKTVLQPFFIYIDKWIGTLVDGLGEVVGFFNEEWGDAIKGFADTLHNLDDEIVAWADRLGEAARANKEARATVREVEDALKAQEGAANSAGDAIEDYANKVKLVTGELHDLTKIGVMKSVVTFEGQEPITSYYRSNEVIPFNTAPVASGGVATIDKASMNELKNAVSEGVSVGLSSAHVTLELDGKQLEAVVSRNQYNNLLRLK